MKSSAFIYGYRKAAVDVSILWRFLMALIKTYGLIKGLRMLLKYLQHKNNLFHELPNRYVSVDGNIYVVPDVPPVNARKFIPYLLQDVAVLNEGKKPPLLFGMVCISSMCPYKCSYCYNSSEHSRSQQLTEALVIKTIAAFIEEGAGNIYLTGGEPLTRKALIFDILQNFSGTGTSFWMVTTGSGLDAQLAAELKQLGLRGVMVSLDDSVSDRINLIKGPMAFENACAAIQAASAAGLVVVADCVMSPAMLDMEYFGQYLRFAAALGVHFVNMYVPRPNPKQHDTDIKAFTLKELIQTALLLHSFLKSKKHRQLPLPYSPDAFEAKRGCMGGRLFFYISPDGSVKACPFQKSILGNIRTDDLQQIIKNFRDGGQVDICESNRLMRLQMNDEINKLNK